MQRRWHATMGHDFMTFGTEGIGVHHATQQRLAHAEKHEIVGNARGKGSLRHQLGGMMITLGTLIAGTSAHIQDRQATRPAPAPKPGLIPTR